MRTTHSNKDNSHSSSNKHIGISNILSSHNSHHIINIQALTSSHKETLDDQVPIKLTPQVDSSHMITYNTKIQIMKGNTT